MTPVLAFSDQMITGLVEFSGPAQLSGRLPRPGMRRRGERRARDVISLDARLAADTMPLVTFAILFAGVINGSIAAGAPPRC